MAATDSNDVDHPELSDDVFQSVIVQNGGGSLQVTIPSEIVDDLEIEKGDQIAFHGSEGQEEVTFSRIDRLFS